MLCLLRNHWNIKENIYFFAWQICFFFGRNDKRKVIAAFSFLAVPPKTKKITKIFRQTKNDRFFVQAYCRVSSVEIHTSKKQEVKSFHSKHIVKFSRLFTLWCKERFWSSKLLQWKQVYNYNYNLTDSPYQSFDMHA